MLTTTPPLSPGGVGHADHRRYKDRLSCRMCIARSVFWWPHLMQWWIMTPLKGVNFLTTKTCRPQSLGEYRSGRILNISAYLPFVGL